MDLQLSHILSKSLSKLLDDLTKLSESQIKTTHLDSNNNISNNINPGTSDNDDNNSLEQQFINIIMQHAKDIFLNQPQFKLNKFELQIPSGMVKLSVDASIKNFKESDINSKDALSKKLDIKFQFSTPKNVLAYLLNLQMKYLLSAGNAEMDEQSLAAFNSVVNILLDNQINAWSKKSYIQNNNGIISGNFMLSDGELLINNIPSK